MVRKRERGPYMTASSSPDAEAHLRLPNEVLSLGARIVRELELDESNKTLGRWMAHHLAEVLKSAEVADEANKERLEKRAVSLILELWAHRRHLPGSVYPLAQLGEVVSVVRRLNSDAFPFRGRSTSELEELLWRVFNALQVIVVHGTLAAANAGKIPDDFESNKSFFTEEENEIYGVLKGWIDFRSPEKFQYEILSHSEEEAFDADSMRSRITELNELDPATRARRIVNREIKGLMQTLAILQSKLSDGSCETDDEG